MQNRDRNAVSGMMSGMMGNTSEKYAVLQQDALYYTSCLYREQKYTSIHKCTVMYSKQDGEKMAMADNLSQIIYG